MAKGWVNDDSVANQITDSVNDEICRARQQLPSGESLLRCEECDEEIPQARRLALPGVRLCVECQRVLDKERNRAPSINRRASKDSQLR